MTTRTRELTEFLVIRILDFERAKLPKEREVFKFAVFAALDDVLDSIVQADAAQALAEPLAILGQGDSVKTIGP